jgi:hypothetical protein
MSFRESKKSHKHKSWSPLRVGRSSQHHDLV